jgi:glutathione transport system permease protein
MSAALADAAIRSPLAEFWRRFRRKWLALGAGLVLLALIAAAIAAPLVAPFDPATPDYNAVLQAPTLLHLCGTDAYGRDVFSRIVWGGRVSLSIGFLSVALGGTIGVLIGLIAGFVGGRIDGMLMRMMDVLLAFPGIVPAIAVVAVLGPGIDNVIYAIAIFSVPVCAASPSPSSRPFTCKPPAASACGR